MNYLGHLYLSQSDDDLALGNFIADFVKGSSYKNYTPEIAQGILMHREIDHVTDNHESYRVAKELFNESHGKYRSVVSDIVYDYVLAKDWDNRNEYSLFEFQNDVNRLILTNFKILPFKVKVMSPFFIRNKWLVLYSSIDTLHRVLWGMQKYRGIKGDADKAIQLLIANEIAISDSFKIIVKDLLEFTVPKYLSNNQTNKTFKSSKIIRF